MRSSSRAGCFVSGRGASSPPRAQRARVLAVASMKRSCRRAGPAAFWAPAMVGRRRPVKFITCAHRIRLYLRARGRTSRQTEGPEVPDVAAVVDREAQVYMRTVLSRRGASPPPGASGCVKQRGDSGDGLKLRRPVLEQCSRARPPHATSASNPPSSQQRDVDADRPGGLQPRASAERPATASGFSSRRRPRTRSAARRPAIPPRLGERSSGGKRAEKATGP